MRCEACDNPAVFVTEHYYHDHGHCGFAALCAPCAERECSPNENYRDLNMRPPSDMVWGALPENVDNMNILYYKIHPNDWKEFYNSVHLPFEQFNAKYRKLLI